MNIKKIVFVKGQIKALTGLHIGGSSDIIEIGGNDNPVIKNPVTGDPYIPASSLKGKMRMLLEWRLGKIGNDGKIHVCIEKDCPICRIFGVPSNKNVGIGPSRLIVRDAELNPEWKKKAELKETLLTEDKYENWVNRLTAKADPRQVERVVPGALFDFELVYKVFDMGDGGKLDEDYFKYVLEALKLVEVDYLGGLGSRGSGKVRFINLKKSLYGEGGYTEITLPNLAQIIINSGTN
ncbi:MAG: type III-A CRISPR-associated RAMP protein Csm3 [Actinobacteria bacterium]|nr:type III-A CRISPR-associated RAMP protein Csm3 [Actinomycetota bacterium]